MYFKDTSFRQRRKTFLKPLVGRSVQNYCLPFVKWHLAAKVGSIVRHESCLLMTILPRWNVTTTFHWATISEKLVSMIASNALGKRYDKAFSSHDDGDTTRWSTLLPRARKVGIAAKYPTENALTITATQRFNLCASFMKTCYRVLKTELFSWNVWSI